MRVIKLKYVCRFARLLAVAVIPAFIMLVMGNRMRSDESVDDYLKRHESEKVK